MSATSAASSVVVDASLAIWAILPAISPVETTTLFGDWRRQGLRLVAPSLWLEECTSAIRATVHARAIAPDEGRLALEDILLLEVDTVPPTADRCRSALRWAERLGQSRAYDGFYLALAEELGAEFWTADRRLASGAKQAGAIWVHSV